MFTRFIPPAGPARTLALSQLISTAGDGAYYVSAALFFTRIVGLTPIQMGLGLTIAGAFGLFASVPLGHVADRRGARGTAVVLTLGAGVACAAFLFARSFAPFVIAACAYMICQRGAVAARQAVLGGLVEESKRTEISAYMATAANIGFSVGAAIGGTALFFDTHEAYLTVIAMDALSFFLAALMMSRLPKVKVAPADGKKGRMLAVLQDRPYALVALINMFMLLHIPLIDVALPLWTTQYTAAPRWVLASLFLLNTVSIVLFQIRFARKVVSLEHAIRYMRHAGLVLFASCLVFAASSIGTSAWVASAVLLIAAALQAIGEMMQFPSAWEISFKLAPAGKHGQYQGLFNSGFSAAEMIGPIFLTTLVVAWGPPGWLLLGVLFVVAGFAMGPAVRWAAARQAPAPSAEAAERVVQPG